MAAKDSKVVGVGLISAISRFQVQHSNHLAMISPENQRKSWLNNLRTKRSKFYQVIYQTGRKMVKSSEDWDDSLLQVVNLIKIA